MKHLNARIARIRDDHEHGSRWLMRMSIELLRDLAAQPTTSPAEQLRQLHHVGRELAHARPSMAALAGAVRRILTAPGGLNGMAQVAEQLLQEYDQAPVYITTFARPYLRGTILTHSLSGTVLEVLNACVPPIEHIIMLEGRPLYEGRTVAQSLRQRSSVALTLLTDAQADIFLPMCQAVVVGADSILADGSLINKAGTALLAWAAHGHGIPFYVLAETLKIAPYSWSGDLTLLEEQSSHDVWPEAFFGVAVRNFIFDHTPAELVTAFITEQGVLTSEEIAQRAREVQQLCESLE